MWCGAIQPQGVTERVLPAGWRREPVSQLSAPPLSCTQSIRHCLQGYDGTADFRVMPEKSNSSVMPRASKGRAAPSPKGDAGTADGADGY